MSLVLVQPTFDMQIAASDSAEAKALISAMEQVGSPIGAPYINPLVVQKGDTARSSQIITVEERDGLPTAVQSYGLIDSNQVKNYRNRLRAAGLVLWNDELGSRAVEIEELPWLPQDVPYAVYFGMALLPMTTFMAAALLGAVLTAQDFEGGTILELRLSPVPVALVLGARISRLVLTACLSACLLLCAIGLVTDDWPIETWRFGLALLPVAVFAACLGICAGLLFRKTIPSFVTALASALLTWIMGSSFGLAGGFGGLYEAVSKFTPNNYAVELLFPSYYGRELSPMWESALPLLVAAVAALILTGLLYRYRVLRAEELN